MLQCGQNLKLRKAEKSMQQEMQRWLEAMGQPSGAYTGGKAAFEKSYAYPDYTVELYVQPNGAGTTQRVMKVFPAGMKGPFPAVAVPFYFPEAMLGFEPDTGEALPRYAGVEMMVQLAKRGYACASADAYYMTYIQSDKGQGVNFASWKSAGEALRRDHPGWSGMGKLVADTKLLIDTLAEDPRVDADRIGIAGHSLGGKMAFYTGCLDGRVKAILASDMGLGWDQTNWRDIWYWGDQVETLIAAGMDHAGLLGCGGKPFCLIAGEFDNMDSWDLMCRAPGYEAGDERLKIINHATGHRPPMWALEEGYDFLDRWM